MRKVLLILVALSLIGCGGLRKGAKMKPRDGVVFYAKSYLGTPYAYGGNTKNGIDCSGLIHKAYQKQGVRIPRTVNELRKKGKRISVDRAKKGDIVFFRTSRKRKLTHAGIVVQVRKGIPQFIHASTSRGVMISSLANAYWEKRYAQTRRLLRK
jgi:probable lipoprotein NlpC